MSVTRRDVLLAGAVGTLAACTSSNPPDPQPVDPDVALRAAAVDRERALVAAYDEALAGHPSLATRWGPLRADHAAHLARLLPEAVASPEATASPAVPTGAPGTVETRRRALLALERAAAREHGTAVVAASRSLAPVLASLAACEAGHAVLL